MNNGTPAIVIEHTLPGRVRLRSCDLRDSESASEALAALSELDGVLEAHHNQKTGSLLVLFDPEKTHSEAILQAVKSHVRATPTQEPCFHTVAKKEMPTTGGTRQTEAGTKLARSFARFWEDLDEDLFITTKGLISLGTIMPIGFLTLGFTNVMRTKRVPSPPWFNLFWMSFRTFMVLNKEAIEHAHDDEPDEGGDLEQVAG